MNDTAEPIAVLRYFCRQTTGITIKVASECFSALNKVAQESGLVEDNLLLCSEFIIKKCKTSRITIEVLKCMLPRNTVPDQAVINVLIWIKEHFRQGCKQAVTLALRWIAGLLEFSLVNEKPINNFYHLFLALLDFPHTQVVSCWIVTRLSQPSDVERSLVLQILKLKQKSKSKSFDSVLWTFKTLKPECVPEHVATRNAMANLKINDLFKQSFAKAQERNVAQGSSVTTKLRDQIWMVSEGRKRRRVDVIPGVEYVHFGSSLYRKKEQSILAINNWRKLSINFWNISIPCNAVSLLQNEFGHHFLIFRGPNLQQRFSYTLYYTLHSVIIDRSVNTRFSDQELLLDKICELQEYMQEGIPVVSRFLATYISFWDGFTFLPQIFRLLPWVTFSSYNELYQFFLVHIYYIYISSNVNVKCGILKMLQNLITNLAIGSISSEKKLFVHSTETEQFKNILQNLLQFVYNLSVLGLNFECHSATLLSQVLQLYEYFVILEEQINMPVKSVLPPVAMYYSLFSRNQINLGRVCSLLLIYNTYRSEEKKHLTIVLQKHSKYIEMYVNDFINVLWLKRGIQKRKYGYVFRHLHPFHVSALPPHLDTSLSLSEYPPLQPYFMHKNGIDNKRLQGILQRLLPKVCEFLKVVLSK